MQDLTKLLQRDGVVMMVLVDMMVWMIMMMIPMKSSLMMVLMVTISPLREGISPAEICLSESSFSLGVFRPVEAAKSFCGRSPYIRVSRRRYRREGGARDGPGWTHPL